MSKEDKTGTMTNIKPNYGAITGGYSAPVIPTPVVSNYGSVTGGGSAVVEGGETPKPTTYGAILAQLEQARQGARDQARSTYDQATIGANAQYDRAKSNYGATADALVRSGLANSGYSNNIDAAAYAARARQLEGAQSNYGQALLNADKAYNEGVVAAEMGRQAKYEDILKAIGEGTITSVQGAQIGKDYGLSESQQKSLDKNVESSQVALFSEYSNMLGGGNVVDLATLKNEEDNQLITPTQAADIRAKNILNYKNAFATGETEGFANVLKSLEANKSYLDKTEYQDIYNTYAKRVVKDADAVTSTDRITAVSDALAELEELRANDSISEPMYTQRLADLLRTNKPRITQGAAQEFEGEKVNFVIGENKYGVKLKPITKGKKYIELIEGLDLKKGNFYEINGEYYYCGGVEATTGDYDYYADADATTGGVLFKIAVDTKWEEDYNKVITFLHNYIAQEQSLHNDTQR